MLSFLAPDLLPVLALAVAIFGTGFGCSYPPQWQRPWQCFRASTGGAIPDATPLLPHPQQGVLPRNRSQSVHLITFDQVRLHCRHALRQHGRT